MGRAELRRETGGWGLRRLLLLRCAQRLPAAREGGRLVQCVRVGRAELPREAGGEGLRVRELRGSGDRGRRISRWQGLGVRPLGVRWRSRPGLGVGLLGMRQHSTQGQGVQFLRMRRRLARRLLRHLPLGCASVLTPPRVLLHPVIRGRCRCSLPARRSCASVLGVVLSEADVATRRRGPRGACTLTGCARTLRRGSPLRGEPAVGVGRRQQGSAGVPRDAALAGHQRGPLRGEPAVGVRRRRRL
mmetsp:Transcript_93059/g.295161  ORF Transcript_93059/g.295161 Transcript_93059/m.295161 type:complete len:245 (+) Transcript_93059:378-1112(+)